MAKCGSFIFILSFLFLITLTSAFEFDNVKNYDILKKKVTVRNSFLLYPTDKVAEIKLNTPLEYYVAPGYQKVAEFDVNNLENYDNALRKVDFYDIRKGMEKINRTFDYKIKGYQNFVEDVYQTSCSDKVYDNKSIGQNCVNEKVGTRVVRKVVWHDFNSRMLNRGNYTIGIFTDVKIGDRVEWIPTFFGVEIKEWAVWTASLNVGLISYYKMDDNSSNILVKDSVKVNNGTLQGGENTDQISDTGIINLSLDFDGSLDFVNLTDIDSYVTTNKITLSSWVNGDVFSGVDTILAQKASSLTRAYVFDISSANPRFILWNSSGGLVVLTSPSTINTSEWNHIVATYNSSLARLYVNGVEVDNGTLQGNIRNSPNQVWIANNQQTGGELFDGSIDEIGIWNRSLTDAEVLQVYNNGSGITFIEGISVSLNQPLNSSLLGTNNVQFNCSALVDKSINLTNMSLYTNATGSWAIINTTSGINSYNSTQVWNNYFPSGNYIWNCEACTTINECSFADNNYSFKINDSLLNINVINPSGVLDYNYVGGEETLNYSVDSGLDTCWYNYNGTNVTVSCGNNAVNFTLVDKLNLTFYVNDSLGNQNSSLVQWSYQLFEKNITFSPNITEGETNLIAIEVNIPQSSAITNSSLSYNGTNYSTSIIFDGVNYFIASTNLAPLVNANTVLPFSFFISVDGVEYQTNSNNQTVLNLNFAPCGGVSNDTLLNASLFDEELLTTLIGNIEMNVNVISKSSGQVVAVANGTFNNTHSAAICFSPVSAYSLYYLDVEIRYTANNYATEFYHIDQADMANYPSNLSLFVLNINDSTEFTVTYKNDDFIFTDGAVIQLQRKYVGEDVYRTVEAPLTGDGGQAILHIDLNNIKYRASVVKDGVTLSFFDNIVFSCENELAGDCTHSLDGTVNPNNDIPITTITDFSYSISVNETQNSITVLFAIPSGTASTVNVVLEQIDMFGNSTACNTTVITSAGSITCNYLDTIEKSILRLSVSKDNVELVTKSYELNPDVDMDGMNFFISFLFLISLVGMSLASPEWVVLISVLVLVINGTLLLINGMNLVVGLGALAWIIIAAVIIIYKIAKQEDR